MPNAPQLADPSIPSMAAPFLETYNLLIKRDFEQSIHIFETIWNICEKARHDCQVMIQRVIWDETIERGEMPKVRNKHRALTKCTFDIAFRRDSSCPRPVIRY